MSKQILFSSFLLFSAVGFAQNQVPIISNVAVNVPWGATHADITFDVSDTENDPMEIKLLLSDNGGQTHIAHVGTITGDVGFPVQSGTAKHIVWNFDTLSSVYNYSIRLVADDRIVPNIQDIVDAVDSNRLRSDLEYISGVRHYLTNPIHLAEVKDTIESLFVDAGLETRRHDFERAAGIPGQNIIGRKPGLGSEDHTFIIDAHFDSVDDAPGADDNGSGVVGFLEALRVLKPYNFTKSIRFIGFDFEESAVNSVGTWGSLQYCNNQIPAWETQDGVINFEMIGYYTNEPNTQQVPTGFNVFFPTQNAILLADSFRGNFITDVGDDESIAFENDFESLSNQYVPDLKVIKLNLPQNGLIALDFRRSDHANFWDKDVPALLITDGANFRNLKYHTPGDTLGNLNFTFMSNVVKASVATVAALAGIQHSSYKDADIIPSGIPTSTVSCPIQVYPVPVKDFLNIRAGNCFEKGFSLSILDLQGKTIFEEKATSKNYQFDTKKLAKGVFFLQLKSGNDVSVKKIILE